MGGVHGFTANHVADDFPHQWQWQVCRGSPQPFADRLLIKSRQWSDAGAPLSMTPSLDMSTLRHNVSLKGISDTVGSSCSNLRVLCWTLSCAGNRYLGEPSIELSHWYCFPKNCAKHRQVLSGTTVRWQDLCMHLFTACVGPCRWPGKTFSHHSLCRGTPGASHGRWRSVAHSCASWMH